MAVLYCPECGAIEPDWNGSRVDPDSKSAKIEADAKVIEGLQQRIGEAECRIETDGKLIDESAKVIAALREANEKLGSWMSAALDDPNVCAEMKADITTWFTTFEQTAGEK